MTPTAALAAKLAQRVDDLDWTRIRASLDEVGIAAAGPILTRAQSGDVTALYRDDERFRSTIDRSRHRFGEGQYRYFAYPLPAVVADRRRLWLP